MKMLFFILYLLIISYSFAFSQSAWVWQNPLPQGNNLAKVKYLNQNTGWAVGVHGAIVKTTDGGMIWNVLYNDYDSLIIDFHFIDSLTVYACSIKNQIIKSTNGGINWNIIYNSTDYFYKIYFSDAKTGYVSGADQTTSGIMLKTTDAGDHWVNIFTYPYTETQLYDFQFFNNTLAYATLGDFDFGKTTNGGHNWGMTWWGWGTLNLYFLDSLNGYTVGGYVSGFSPHGTIRKTTNGGYNFITLLDSEYTYQNSGGYKSVYFTNLTTGYVAGFNGEIRKTTNSGINWAAPKSNTKYTLNSLGFINTGTGVVVGDYGTILKTTNDGNNWTNYTKGKNNNLRKCCFINENTGFAGGDYCLLKTSNGGLNWITKIDSNAFVIYDFKFLNQNTGYALSSNLSYTYLLKTTDCGETWNSILAATPIQVTQYTFTSLSIVDEFNIWICGFSRYNEHPYYNLIRPVYYRTTNGGINWSGYTGSGIEPFAKIIFFNNNNGLIFGRDSHILKTSNSGSNWFNIPLFISGKNLGDACFINQNTGWVSYYDNSIRYSSIFKTTNGGNNWFFQDSIFNAHFYSICVDSSGNCWAVGIKGPYLTSSYQSSVIYSSSNGGNNWMKQRTPTDYSLNSVSFVNPNTGWIVGNTGTILKTTLGIISEVNLPSTNLPKVINLFQNYPNPFNPNTTIKFETTSKSHVELKIFDILGKEVKSLINQYLAPGSYSVEFNGTSLPSGIYFYRMRAGDLSETKQMILVK